MLNYEITTRYGLPCTTQIFTINGQNANDNDFGEGFNDTSTPDYKPIDYGCGYRRWEKTNDERQIKETMKKYHIKREEFEVICGELESKLTVGYCGWCV